MQKMQRKELRFVPERTDRVGILVGVAIQFGLERFAERLARQRERRGQGQLAFFEPHNDRCHAHYDSRRGRSIHEVVMGN